MKKSYRKRLFSLALTMCVTASYLPFMHAAGAEQPAKYPYAVFAADEQKGVSFTLNSLTLNGNGYTNGTFSNTAKSGNMNGRISVPNKDATASDIAEETFDVKMDMIYIHNKLIDTYFSGDYQSFDADYALSEMNNHVNQPIYVVGKLSVDGNLALNSALGAVSDIILTNGNVNGNNSVLYSKFGNIRIEGEQVSVNGLIYAPFGNVIIDCADFNTNGLIIAQNVIVTGSGANINYNDSVAQFVGTETEALSWGMEDFKFLADTDSDGLPDVIEKEYKTDPFVADTDGDTLPDGYEVLTLGTNPLVVDTDANGINDNEEDFDTDDLNNGDEYLQGTDPFSDDSDGDTLIDGDEVKKYATNPLVVDSDQDGLDDPDELYFNTDPNVKDTDKNGILDGDEKRNQTFIHEAENKDSAVTKVTVTMNGTGNLQKSTKIRSIMDKDYLCTNVVGLIGEPYSIETTSKFDKATLTFTVDQTKLGDTKFEDLLFLWHDEENHEFVELDTIYDAASSTVSVETTHFSKYMIVDKEKWFEAWAVKFNYNPSTEHASVPSVYYNTVLAIDCSGSMDWNDSSNDRVKAAEGFIDSMNTNDQAAIVLFDSYATTVQALTSNKTALKTALNKVYSSGGTSFDPAISTSLSVLDSYINQPHYSNRIILLSDGESSYSETYLQTAKQKYVKIHTVGLGSSSYDSVLKNISSYTGGEFYKALTASELVDIYTDIGIGGDFDTTDTDGDGLYDAVEAAGMRLENGTIIYSNPTTKHSDTDGLEDGEEMDPTIRWKDIGSTAGYSRDREYFFVMYSDPMKDDTDGDGIRDDEDFEPTISAHNELIDPSDKDELRRRLKEQRWSDIATLTWLKSVYMADKCVDLIFDNDQIITDIANKYSMPKSYIQSVLFREIYCYGLDDPAADFAFENYYLFQEQVEFWMQQDTIYQATVPYPTPLIPQRENTSTGLGQIQLVTAISANNWGYGKGYKSSYLTDTWQTRRDIYLNLQDPSFNIDMVAIVLMWGLTTGDECAVSDPGENYWYFTEEQIKAMFSRYNSNGGVINDYGNAAYNLYLIFEDYT